MEKLIILEPKLIIILTNKGKKLINHFFLNNYLWLYRDLKNINESKKKILFIIRKKLKFDI